MKKIFNIITAFLAIFVLSCDLGITGDNGWKSGGGEYKGAKIVFDKFTVYSDDNGDDIINPGEKITLNVSLKNTGEKDANNVKAKFSSKSEYISDLTNTDFSYYSIVAGSTNSSYYDANPSFKVSTSAPNGTEIIINIDIEDDKGNKWTDSFKVTVSFTNANIKLNEAYIYSDDNGDKIINPGEEITLDVSLKNIGTSNASGIKAKFTSSSPYISDLLPTIYSFNSISAERVNSTYYCNANPSFKVSASAANGTEIVIDIEIVDDKGNKWFDSFRVIVKSEMPNIVFNTTQVLDDNNLDGKIEQGETITLEVSLKNIGVVDANAVNAQFSSMNSYISGITTAPVFYGTISAKENAAKNIQFTIAGNTPSGTKIPIDVNITDGSGNNWIQQFEITVN